MSVFFGSGSDWPTRKKPSEYNENRSKFVLLRASWNSFFLSFCHNYVQLQFHKSMIYSYGLHFYSIRLPYTQKSTFFGHYFQRFLIFFDINVNLLSCNDFSQKTFLKSTLGSFCILVQIMAQKEKTITLSFLNFAKMQRFCLETSSLKTRWHHLKIESILRLDCRH